MSLIYQTLCNKVLQEYFGDIVGKIGGILLQTDSVTLCELYAKSKLPSPKVKEALCVLIKHNLVIWKEIQQGIPSYSILNDRILSILRFPRYVFLVRELFGEEAEMVVDIIAREGQITASHIIISSCLKLIEATANEGNEVSEDKHITLRNSFATLVNNQFIQQCPNPDTTDIKKVPILTVNQDTLYVFNPNSIDLKLLQQEIRNRRTNSEQGSLISSTRTLFNHPDSEIYWRLNYDRFHLEFRDSEIRNSLSRRIDPLAGACLGAILKVAYKKSDPWQHTLTGVIASEIREQQRDLSYLEQYLKILVESGGGVLQKVGDAGGGEYVVNIGKVLETITLSHISSIIQERYGSKGARIFRLVKAYGMMEQDHITKLSMMSKKEANALMSQLLQNGFLQLHELRKTIAPSPVNKSIFLYYVDTNKVVTLLLEWCYKVLYNLMVQREIRQLQNKRLLDRKTRVETIVENLKQSGGSDEQIREVEEIFTPSERKLVETVLQVQDKLLDREIALDETLFSFQMYTYYHTYNQ